MDMINLLEELKGGRSQVEFASSLGIDQPSLSRILRRERQISAALLQKLLLQFPEQRDRIIAVFLSQENANQGN